jgi:hypothetical protein
MTFQSGRLINSFQKLFKWKKPLLAPSGRDSSWISIFYLPPYTLVVQRIIYHAAAGCPEWPTHSGGSQTAAARVSQLIPVNHPPRTGEQMATPRSMRMVTWHSTDNPRGLVVPIRSADERWLVCCCWINKEIGQTEKARKASRVETDHIWSRGASVKVSSRLVVRQSWSEVKPEFYSSLSLGGGCSAESFASLFPVKGGLLKII